MALHDLVKLRQSLTDSLVTDTVVDELLMLRNRIENIKLQVPLLQPEHANYLNTLLDYYDDIIIKVNVPVNNLAHEIFNIDSQIQKIVTKLFTDNYELETRYGNHETVRNTRRIYINDDIESAIKQRIWLYTNWHYPTLEIGCRDGEWTQHLISADPLYIIDRHQEFLDSTIKRFTGEYQKRIRPYNLINNDLSLLPQEQFGFVFSWGYFNYISLDTMKYYLSQIYKLLRPGGICMFSYNDGDTPAGAGMAENFAQTYMPKSQLIPIAKELGYELINNFQPGTNIYWIEFKRPGILNTVKAHQVLGQIKFIR